MTPLWRRRLLAGSVLCTLAVLAWLRPGMDHSPWAMLRLFDADVRAENFRGMDRIFPSRAIPASARPQPFARATPTASALPPRYHFNGQSLSVAGFIARTQTTGLLVLKDGEVIHEEYRLGAGANSRFTSWSVGKSFVATLTGIALQEGTIRSLDDTVAQYVPDYAGSAWANVRIRDLLRMASGIRFDERYDTRFSDIQRVLQHAYVLGTPVDDTVRNYPAEATEQPPGSRFHYISVNTQVLANVLRHATGQRLTDYLWAKLWNPLGMEAAAYWSLDAVDGREVGYCCLNATLRDYAKLGQLYLQQGRWQGTQLLAAEWVQESTRRPESWLQAGVAQPERGYGYHWWIPPGADGEYFANGIWGQVIWVDERQGVVIVKASADPAFQANMAETIAFMRGIARGLPAGP